MTSLLNLTRLGLDGACVLVAVVEDMLVDDEDICDKALLMRSKQMTLDAEMFCWE